MNTGGWNRLSAQEKAARGTAGANASRDRRKAALAAAHPGAGLTKQPIGPPPEGSSPEFVAAWRYLARCANAVGMTTCADEAVFHVMTLAWIDFNHCRERGTNFGAIAQMARTFHGIACRFGMDPSSRGKHALHEPPPALKDADFFEPIALHAVPK